jgi:hypothetical protein
MLVFEEPRRGGTDTTRDALPVWQLTPPMDLGWPTVCRQTAAPKAAVNVSEPGRGRVAPYGVTVTVPTKLGKVAGGWMAQ